MKSGYLLIWFMFFTCVTIVASDATPQATNICQVRGLDADGDDYLAVRQCAQLTCPQIDELHEGDTVACGDAVESTIAWREVLVGGEWRFVANRYLRTLAVEPHPNLPTLSLSREQPSRDQLYYLDACYQCMKDHEKALYLKNVLAELVFQTGAGIIGEGDRETGNLCAAFANREDTEQALALASRLFEAAGLQIKVSIIRRGCPVG